jgi:hypothetical protein
MAGIIGICVKMAAWSVWMSSARNIEWKTDCPMSEPTKEIIRLGQL